MVKDKKYLEGYIAGQWETADRLLNLLNTIEGPLRRTDFYRIILEYKPGLPEKSS